MTVSASFSGTVHFNSDPTQAEVQERANQVAKSLKESFEKDGVSGSGSVSIFDNGHSAGATVSASQAPAAEAESPPQAEAAAAGTENKE